MENSCKDEKDSWRIPFVRIQSHLRNLISAPKCRSSRPVRFFFHNTSRDRPVQHPLGYAVTTSCHSQEVMRPLHIGGETQNPHNSVAISEKPEHSPSCPEWGPGHRFKFTVKLISGHVGDHFLNGVSLPTASEIRPTK